MSNTVALNPTLATCTASSAAAREAAPTDTTKYEDVPATILNLLIAANSAAEHCDWSTLQQVARNLEHQARVAQLDRMAGPDGVVHRHD